MATVSVANRISDSRGDIAGARFARGTETDGCTQANGETRSYIDSSCMPIRRGTDEARRDYYDQRGTLGNQVTEREDCDHSGHGNDPPHRYQMA